MHNNLNYPSIIESK